MIALLAESPLLLLFLIAAIGYPLGRLRVGGVSLGVAAVLFTGLAFGALSPDLKVPPLLYEFGLLLFVYTVGLASGPSFVASLKRTGLRDNGLVLGVFALAAAALVGLARGLGVSGPHAAGLFAGAFTNTPALAGVLERLRAAGADEAALSAPVVAYSVAYPMGVVAMILVTTALRRLWRVPAAAPPEPIGHTTVRVERPEALAALPGGVRMGRFEQAGRLGFVDATTILKAGDLVSLIGPERLLDVAVPAVGEDLGEALELSREHLDMRRVFVSEPRVAGQRLGDLGLARLEAAVTRVRRGDVDLLADDRFVLQLGDRVRVVAPRRRMGEVARLFGDSFTGISEIDVLTFSVGIVAGVLLGLVPVPLGDGNVFRLGLAGGPLLVGLALGALGRTGPMQWQIPFNANLTLRQIGLILFLAGVGSRSGYAFAHTVLTPLGLLLFLAGAALTAGAGLLLLAVAVKGFRMPFAYATGLVAGFQTQPALLGFATETLQSEEPNVGYATVYPVATVAKLVLAQLLLGLAAGG